MRIFVDIDGTLTKEQRVNSVFKSPWRQDVIDKVKELIIAGHEIIIWSGSTEYAEAAAEALGLPCIAIGKPQLWVDNEVKTWGKRICRRMITPEEFLEKEF